MTTEWIYTIFAVLVLGLLGLDLGVFHKDSHEVKMKEALTWSGIWVLVALGFSGLVYSWHGGEASLQFTTGYLIEKALSVDNLFVFLMLFTHFRIPAKYQHKILFWGIIGALLMRAVFIGLGVALIERFHFVIYIFGAFLIYSGIKMAFHKDNSEDNIEDGWMFRTLKKLLPFENTLADGHFTIIKDGKKYYTTMFLVLLIVEATDVLFAVDSVPAVLAVSRDPFIVYSSNVFAILGLRSLYFALAGLLNLFHYLHYGLCLILLFVGGKMIASAWFHFPVALSLLIILSILVLSIVASLVWPQKKAIEN